MSYEMFTVISALVMYIFVGGVALILMDSAKKDEQVIRLTPLGAIIVWPYVLYKVWRG